MKWGGSNGLLFNKFHKEIFDYWAYWVAHGAAKTLCIYGSTEFKIVGSEDEFQKFNIMIGIQLDRLFKIFVIHIISFLDDIKDSIMGVYSSW